MALLELQGWRRLLVAGIGFESGGDMGVFRARGVHMGLDEEGGGSGVGVESAWGGGGVGR